MMNVRVEDKKRIDGNGPCCAFLVREGEVEQDCIGLLPAAWQEQVRVITQKREFTGKKLQKLAFPVVERERVVQLIIVGVGNIARATARELEMCRRAVGIVVRELQAIKGNSLALVAPSASACGTSSQNFAQQLTVAAHLANYHFNDYLTEASKKAVDLSELTLFVDAEDIKGAQEGAKIGVCVGNATNKARHWIDLPPVVLTPAYLAERAQEVAQQNGLACTVFGEPEIIKMGMGGLAAVARGSDLDCKLVILEYKTSKANAPTVAFVGKGITFDSGGLSIKPAASMETMKEDMSGAAAVIATMEAIAQLKPNINIVGLAPITENLPSGKATKPGDIVRFYNGKTAEIKNTDAEGRLILADALSYAVKHYKPAAMIDLATLTGACSYALGPFFSGMMSQHDEFVARVEKAAASSGDRVWRLPLDDDYQKAIENPVADICNIGSSKYRAGAITAAFFLKAFVDEVPWVHLDIAGTAYDVPDISYYRPGATGYGVRLLVDLAMQWA